MTKIRANKPKGRPKGSKNKKASRAPARGRVASSTAYRGGVKANFQSRRRPFVEGKIRNHADFSLSLPGTRDMTNQFNFPDPRDYMDLPTDDAFTLLLPVSFYHLNRGLHDHEMIGNAIYAKYLKMKMSIMFPAAAYSIEVPYELRVIWGFVTQDMVLSAYTTPNPTEVTYEDVYNHVGKLVKEYYDTRKDQLDFPEKVEQNIRFLGNRRVKVDRNGQIPAFGATGMGHSGALAPKNISLSFPLQRKVHYQEGTKSDDLGSGPEANFLYPHKTWLPFCCIFQPQFASLSAGSDYKVKIAYNDQLWFSDS